MGQVRCIQWLLTLGFTLGFSAAVLEVHLGQPAVVAIEGQRIVIPAWYTSVSGLSPFITWVFNKSPSKPTQILKYMNDVAQPEETPFKNRVEFVYARPIKNLSISITNSQEADSGLYTCSVNIPDENPIAGGNIGVVNVTVLVPPSTPICQLHGSPHTGGNMTLSCSSSTAKPLPLYSWKRVAPRTLIFYAPIQDSSKGTLSLTNLTSEMSGTYVCTAENLAGTSNCNVTFEVTTPVNTAVIVGAVVGSILGVLLVITVILLICFYKRKIKEAQEEMANEIREDAPAPKTPSWAKSIGSDTISRNGTLSSVITHRDDKPYPPKPMSDTASIITAAGSTVGYKPSYVAQQSGALTPTPSLSSQSLPVYLPPPQNGHLYSHQLPTNRNAHQRTNGAVPQMPRQEQVAPSGVTHSNLARMGAVPVMVPAQSQAGSLV